MLSLFSTWADRTTHEELSPAQSVPGSALLHGIVPFLDQDIAFALVRLHDFIQLLKAS